MPEIICEICFRHTWIYLRYKSYVWDILEIYFRYDWYVWDYLKYFLALPDNLCLVVVSYVWVRSYTKFQTSTTFLPGRIEFDGGVGEMVVLVVCKVIFMSNPTSVEARLGWVDVVVGVVTIVKYTEH